MGTNQLNKGLGCELSLDKNNEKKVQRKLC